MKRGFKARKIALVIVIAIAAVFLFSFIVMMLWNAILPKVTNAGELNIWQAMGLLLLAKILFSGFHRHHHDRPPWARHLRKKWRHMTPEEKEQFKAALKERCRWKFGQDMDNPKSAPDNQPE
jgi:hypothetical protein